MAVQLDLAAIDPSPDFIAYGGKRPETVFLLIDEHLQPGAASLLERRLVVLLELLQHAIAEILKRVETPVAVQIAVFSGQQGRILRPVRVIFDGQSFSVV